MTLTGFLQFLMAHDLVALVSVLIGVCVAWVWADHFDL